MMNPSIKGVAKLIWTDLRISLVIFWSILFAVFGIALYFTQRFANEVVVSGGSVSIYIFMFIVGVVHLHEMFPYVLGMNVRRTDYFLGALYTNTGLAVAMSVFVTLLALAEGRLAETLGWKMTFFRNPLLEGTGVAVDMLIQFAAFWLLFSVGFAISSLYRRFGRYGMYVTGTIVFVGAVLSTIFKGWGPTLTWLWNLDGLLDFGLWLLPAAALNWVVSYALLRWATASR